MSKLIVVVLSGLFAASMAFAQTPAASTPAPKASSCEAKAIGKTGKPLAGAAKASFMKKCEAEAKAGAASGSNCEAKAISSSGKPLAGAAKTSFIKKCEADAKSSK